MTFDLKAKCIISENSLINKLWGIVVFSFLIVGKELSATQNFL